MYVQRTLKAGEDDPSMTLSDFWKSFNIYMCIKHIDATWCEVSQTSMNSVWKALSPQFVNSVQREDQEEDKKILENLVEIFKKLNIDLEEKDFQKLFQSHLQELTNKELMELETMQGPEEEEILSVKKF